MDWIKNYQLFLFDFDGLLVNTEHLHLEAYRKMCLEYGFTLDLDIATYSRVAQFDATGPSVAITKQFPALKEIEWEVLRGRKNQIYLELIAKGEVELMEGANDLLEVLHRENCLCCVVTHSKPEQIAPIRKKHPQLAKIQHWITRHDYTHPKPHPESYLKAIQQLGKSTDRVIGFEDSPKGLQALLGAGVDGVMINPYFSKEEIKLLVKSDYLHFSSLAEVVGVNHLKEKETLCGGG